MTLLMSEDDNLKMFAAELRDDLLKLDLHGERTNEIEEKIDQFLYSSFRRNESAVEIIYGGGTGALRQATLDFLSRHPLVEKTQEKGGVCLVLLFGL